MSKKVKKKILSKNLKEAREFVKTGEEFYERNPMFFNHQALERAKEEVKYWQAKEKKEPLPETGGIIGAEVVRFGGGLILFRTQVEAGYDWVLFDYKHMTVVPMVTKEKELDESNYTNMVNAINKLIKKK